MRIITGSLIFLCGLCIAFTPPASAEPKIIENMAGAEFKVELEWTEPVDLDLFLTDPAGETVYFANRNAKSGAKMGREASCKEVVESSAPYQEDAYIPIARTGRYRISVDFIKDCGNAALDVSFDVVLKNKGGKEIGRTRAEVQYRLLNPVAWEFVIR